MRTEILAFAASLAICLMGGVAFASYAVRFRSRERDLLWIGLFAVLYGADLVFHSPVFQMGFSSPTEIALFTPRILSACSIVPALLLFEDFYGRGWRSLLHWMIVGYGIAAAGVYAYMFIRHAPELMPSAALILVICVPLVLASGVITGYKPPRLEHANVLFVGLSCFFIAFSVDHLRNATDGHWKPGLEPFGAIVLLSCLSFVVAKRVLADERRLVSLNEEMHAAAAIQESILPRVVPTFQKARIAVRYIPLTAVAGDFYDFPKFSSASIDILLADVMGHGVPAALVASMVKVAVRTHSTEGSDPAQTIQTLNSILCDQVPGQYVTANYLHLNLVTMKGTYAAAAHPAPLLWNGARRELTTLNGGGLLLGVRKGESYSNSEFSLQPGDRLLVYTDGLTEAENLNGEAFGDLRLPGFMAQNVATDTDTFAQSLQKAVHEWSRSSKRGQTDDITFVVIDFPFRG